ncbi:MAG: bifunctional folylpolyglutamate synthase/dihydrofolate synthase [Helicobacteraceae bacterium]|jgi:dihydrofolate synthase/folylpolyglutamate synthase|nr:bifunctional folylpolyglutamate synthase/dihydrofolate synthase [Helicobacteraceae bacterium]
MSALQTFLDAKPLYYDEIDLERMPRIYTAIKDQLPSPKIIHVVGTNGKGTTGRFLAKALLQHGLNVGHYTSPHIVTFNERIWLNGENVSDDVLESAHQKLLNVLTKEQADALSYFEYTTLLAMVVYSQCDYVVLEAGLGGEFDATNVFEKDLSLFTPIDIDHQAFLGNDIVSISGTKFRSMQSSAILGRQAHPEVENIYRDIAKERGCSAETIDDLLSDREQQVIRAIASEKGLAHYLQENLLLALSALKFLGFEADVGILAASPLFGRLSRIKENILLDVGHNVLAAKAIVEALKGEMFTLVYNSYRDKDYAEIIKILKPIIKEVELIDVVDVRIEQESKLREVITAQGVSVGKFATIEKNKNYLVFGSFSVAEAFLAYLARQ